MKVVIKELIIKKIYIKSYVTKLLIIWGRGKVETYREFVKEII